MPSRNAETFRQAHEAFNRRDFNAVVAAMANDVTYHDRARNVTFQGHAGFREFMEGWVTAFSNAEVRDVTYIDAGDTVVAQFTGVGTNDGPLGPFTRTGKTLKLPFCEIMRFNSDGKIISGAAYYDQMTLLTQLGHAQPAEAHAAR